ncbi:hypothetical protein T07_126, partial [Trichinella nelsoni]
LKLVQHAAMVNNSRPLWIRMLPRCDYCKIPELGISKCTNAQLDVCRRSIPTKYPQMTTNHRSICKIGNFIGRKIKKKKFDIFLLTIPLHHANFSPP